MESCFCIKKFYRLMEDDVMQFFPVCYFTSVCFVNSRVTFGIPCYALSLKQIFTFCESVLDADSSN